VCRWEDDVKIDLEEMECEIVEEIDLAYDMDKWQGFCEQADEHQYDINVGTFLTMWVTIFFLRKTVCHKVSEVSFSRRFKF
jgi:hypothetical protein